jgi:hypothetical protein
LIVGAALLAACGGVGWLVRLYVVHPALLKDSNAITEALGDSVAENLVLTSRGTSLFASTRPTPRMPANELPLCTAVALYGADVPDQKCRFTRDPITPGCSNARGCAALTVDPSILQDPILARALHVALTRPCIGLAKDLGAPDEDIHSSLSHPLYLQRLILGCDHGQELTPTIKSENKNSGIVVVRF